MSMAASIHSRVLKVGSARVELPARADQPGASLDAELRLMFRALRRPPLSPCLERPTWDAGIAVADWWAMIRTVALAIASDA